MNSCWCFITWYQWKVKVCSDILCLVDLLGFSFFVRTMIFCSFYSKCSLIFFFAFYWIGWSFIAFSYLSCLLFSSLVLERNINCFILLSTLLCSHAGTCMQTISWRISGADLLISCVCVVFWSILTYNYNMILRWRRKFYGKNIVSIKHYIMVNLKVYYCYVKSDLFAAATFITIFSFPLTNIFLYRLHSLFFIHIYLSLYSLPRVRVLKYSDS